MLSHSVPDVPIKCTIHIEVQGLLSRLCWNCFMETDFTFIFKMLLTKLAIYKWSNQSIDKIYPPLIPCLIEDQKLYSIILRMKHVICKCSINYICFFNPNQLN